MNVGETTAVRGHGARPVAAGDALSVLAGGAARSGRSAALRVISRDGRHNHDSRDRAVGRRRRRASARLPARHRPAVSPGRRARSIFSRAPSSRCGPGQSVALVAPSGAGKSTLLHIAGLLEHPDAGEVYIDAVATSHLSDMQRTRIRRTDIGFVYQFHHLLPEFSALENVMLPQMIRGLSRREATRARRRAAELSRPQGPPHPSAGGAFGRRAAARRHRPRGRQRAAHPARRRADRQSRCAHRRARVRHAQPIGARVRPRRHHRHPQSRSSPRRWTAASPSATA